MLSVQAIHTYYGTSHILQDVSLAVGAGEITTLLGRNGAGKTTTMRSIMGLAPPRAGEIRFKGQPIHGLSTYKIARLGIGYVPEHRGIIPGLTVQESLYLATLGSGKSRRAECARRVEEVLNYFPRLRERLRQQANSLSGGEQQMLAVARALVTGPALLLVDEPTQGLAPMYVQSIMEILTRINREQGVSILLVEQNAVLALKVAHRAYVIDQGVIRTSGPVEEIRANSEVQQRYLGA